ncbi:hypothetical protein NDU88_001186 [Pleurodeles waltl]|uniref:Uncharacterized protein n=1 Tax=Pleurodeles waltl TaxID=8319 RepID=A0AAV7NJC8_PLEWA|nr:hypothetical protein NDU88_001186 [Pleurodeles waltl]
MLIYISGGPCTGTPRTREVMRVPSVFFLCMCHLRTRQELRLMGARRSVCDKRIRCDSRVLSETPPLSPWKAP